MIPDIFDSPVVLRMGWTLLQFIWQGALIALALKGALMLVEPRASRFRYALALGSLFLMIALPVFLFCRPDKRNRHIPAVYEATQFETASSAGSTPASIPAERRPDSSIKVSHLVAPLVPWIAVVWLLGLASLLLKTIGGVIQVRALRRNATAQYNTKETVYFQRLAARAGVGGVPILESYLVSVPTVAGWLRPVVLLPKGVSEKIDHPMLDALIAHEFAHIRRHDGVMNLFQTVIEDLLFFHPAVWWVTRSIRAEREACCDDDAVATCGDTLVYVRALSQAEQFRSSIPVIALSSSPLLQRIRRLTEMKISRMNRAAAFCITLLSISIIAATAAGSLLLATIPPYDSDPSVRAGMPGAASREQNKTGESVYSAQPGAQSKYNLLCGIVGGRQGEATGKLVTVPPPPKDGTESGGACILFDASESKPSIVPNELRASRVVSKVGPAYPESAVKARVGIRVLVSINLNEDGVVTNAEIKRSQTVPPDRDSNGNWVGGAPAGVVRDINSAAMDAVKQWKYSPTLLNGKAIPVTTTVSITFTFSKDGSPKIITYGG